MSGAELTPVEPTPGDIQYLEDRIYEFNSTATGVADGEWLAFGEKLRAAIPSGRPMVPGSSLPPAGETSASSA